jgi:uncharacterized protein with NRDE domain
MCLAVVALHMHPRWPLVIAANRDEFHDRATAPLDWWADATPRILAGKDLSAGGAWMGASEHGRLALLTNVRDPQRQRADAPSRGALVSDWLRSQRSVHDAASHYTARGCNPFNLLLADAGGSRWWWVGDDVADPKALPPGVHGLSNARLNTPWPKVQRLKAAVASALPVSTGSDELARRLFAALVDRVQPADEQLPSTGVGQAVERFLSPAFVAGEGLPRPYGTRSSTVLWVERQADGFSLHMQEQCFGHNGEKTLSAKHVVANWPWQEKSPVHVDARGF